MVSVGKHILFFMIPLFLLQVLCREIAFIAMVTGVGGHQQFLPPDPGGELCHSGLHIH